MDETLTTEVRTLLESVWIKTQMLYAPVDAVASELLTEEAKGAHALGVGLRALYRSLWHDCRRLDELLDLQRASERWAGPIVS